MDGIDLPERVPFVDSHDRSTIVNQLGSTTDIRVEGSKVVAKNIFSSTDEGQRAWTLTKEGHLNTNSIGYQVDRSVFIEPGKTKTIKGRDFTAGQDRGLRVTTKWRIFENSAVVIPADKGAINRELDNSKANTMKQRSILYWSNNMNYEEWLKNRGIDLESLDESQRAELKKDFELINKKPDEPANEPKRTKSDNADDIVDRAKAKIKLKDDAVQEELNRQKAIRELGGSDIPQEVILECIESRKTIEESQAIFFQILKSARAHIGIPAIQIRDNNYEKEDYEATLLMRAGFENMVVKEYGEQRAEKAHQMRDLCLHDLCIRSIILDGKQVPYGRDELIRTAFSGTTLPYLLGAVANKSALAGYREAPATWRSWCSTGSASDFKTNTRVRMTDTGELLEVGNAGEIAHGSASEEFEQFSIATYAKMFSVTRANIINDDLQAFTQTPQKMGRKAGLLVSKLVYTHLLANGNMGDGTALFVSTHSNLNTSTSLDVGGTGLSTSIQAFRQQTDSDGQPIDVEPAILLIPPELETTARLLLESMYTIATSTDIDGTIGTTPSNNIFRGKLELVVENRLSNSNYTGYSATSWYVAGKPGTVDTVEVAFLNGRQEPTVERFDATPDTLGVIYRVYLDVGVKALDWRGLQKNTA